MNKKQHVYNHKDTLIIHIPFRFQKLGPQIRAAEQEHPPQQTGKCPGFHPAESPFREPGSQQGLEIRQPLFLF
jgi:hypothetical protein